MDTSMSETIRGLIENLIKSIVDYPDKVIVEVSTTTKSLLVQIKSEQSDIGKIVGRKGRCIDAIKIIATAAKNTKFLGDKKDVFIEIIEDEKNNYLNKKI